MRSDHANVRYRGNGYLAGESPGLVTINAAPASRALLLLTTNGRLVRVARSAADGTYRFANLDENAQFLLVGRDDPAPPIYQAVARDFLIPVVPVLTLSRTGSVARAICRHAYLQSTPIRVLHADQPAWNANFTISDVGAGWLEFAVAPDLPPAPTGPIVLQRIY